MSIFDFKRTSEEVLVSRIVSTLHQAIDAQYPKATPAPKRFAQTVFSEDPEPTMREELPEVNAQTSGTEARQFGGDLEPTRQELVTKGPFYYFKFFLILLGLASLAVAVILAFLKKL